MTNILKCSIKNNLFYYLDIKLVINKVLYNEYMYFNHILFIKCKYCEFKPYKASVNCLIMGCSENNIYVNKYIYNKIIRKEKLNKIFDNEL